MAYGFNYIAEFVNIKDVDYTLQIWRKNYTGNTYRLNLAANPVLHRYDNDDPKAPIKSSSLTINLINEGNTHPIELFYSNEDDEYLVYFLQGSTLLFKGFLVQDDFSELMVDYNHQIKLVASDNLGLLKDVALDMTGIQAKVPTYAQPYHVTVSPPTQYWMQLTNVGFTPVVGVPFTITNHPISGVNGTYTPTAVSASGNSNYTIRLGTVVTNTIKPEQCTINGISEISLNNNRYSLRDIIYSCLNKAGLNIGFNVYCNLQEQYNRIDRSFLEQTFVDIDTFRTGDAFDNCYNVLDKIMKRFGLSLFQALGEWQIVRWDELKTGTVNGYYYSPLFTYAGVRTLPAPLEFGFEKDTSPQFGLIKYLSRPYEYVSEKFEYKSPQYLLKNYDLQKLGLLLRTVIIDANTEHREYVALDWLGYYGGPPIAERFIRVIIDRVTGSEKGRQLVIRGATFDTARSVQSMPIEVTKGDVIKISYTFNTKFSFSSGVLVFGLSITNGIITRYVANYSAFPNGTWHTNLGWIFDVPPSENTLNDQQVEIKSLPAPFDGIVYVYLTQVPTGTSSDIETRYKDIRMEVIQQINNSVKVKGHQHKDLQLLSIKNNNEDTIIIDDTSSNTILGTLFSGYFTSIAQRRTQYWSRIGVNDTKKIGQITTVDNLQQKSITRLKLEGNFDDIKVGSQNISMLNCFTYSLYPTKIFCFGNLEFDYRNNTINNLTGWEIWDSNELDIDDNYSFNYLYET